MVTFLPFKAYNTDNQLIIDTYCIIAPRRKLQSAIYHAFVFLQPII